MYFKIKFGDFKKLLGQKFSDDAIALTTFYFETERELYLFKILGPACFYTAIAKESDLVAFKQEYLAQAIELLEMPNYKDLVGTIKLTPV
jgi:hypothetical protein